MKNLLNKQITSEALENTIFLMYLSSMFHVIFKSLTELENFLVRVSYINSFSRQNDNSNLDVTSFEDIINIQQKSEFGYLDMDENQTVSEKKTNLLIQLKTKSKLIKILTIYLRTKFQLEFNIYINHIFTR